MSISAEMLLMLGVIAFFLCDSLMLVYIDEVVFLESKGAFRATVGSNILFRGKYLYLPNMLTPNQAIFRTSWAWNRSVEAPEHIAGIRHFVDALAAIKKLCVFLWLLLLVILPTLLIFFSHPMALLILLGFIYTTIGSMVYSAWRYRRALQLTGMELSALALESFACPPFAINFVRKICFKRGLTEGAFSLALRLLDSNERSILFVAIEERVNTCIDFEDEMSPKREALIGFGRNLRGHIS